MSQPNSSTPLLNSPGIHSAALNRNTNGSNNSGYVRSISSMKSPQRRKTLPQTPLANLQSDSETSSLDINKGRALMASEENEECGDFDCQTNHLAGPEMTQTYPINAKVKFSEMLAYYLPVCLWLPSYDGTKFMGDLVAGVTLASFQIPLSLSYATTLAHVPTICGLYGLIVPPVIYLIFGSVPQMIVGPEGAISLVVGQAIEPIMKHHKHEIDSLELVVAISAISGGILLGCGLLRFGFLENVLNDSLLSGFITAVGIVMIINGLIDEFRLHDLFLEVPGHSHSPVEKLRFLVSNFKLAHLPTLIVSLCTFILIVSLRVLKKNLQTQKQLMKTSRMVKLFALFFPEILTVLVFTIIVSYAYDFESLGIETLGEIKASDFKLVFPIKAIMKFEPMEFFHLLVSTSVVVAILGFFESTTASKSLGTQYDLPISSNREFVALGAVNIAGAIFCGLPSFGGYGRSKVNALLGAYTTLSGAIMGLVTLLMTIYLLPYLYCLPICALSVISTIIGLSLLEEAPLSVYFHWQAGGYHELITFCITIVATLFSSIELGIGLGVGYSLLRLIKHCTKSRIQILARFAGKDEFINADEPLFDSRKVNEEILMLQEIEGCLIIKIPEPLTFTNADDLKTRIKRLENYGTNKQHPASQRTRYQSMTRNVVFDVHGMTSIDSSAALLLKQQLETYRRRGIKVYLCRLTNNPKMIRRMTDVGMFDLVEHSSVGVPGFHTIQDALDRVDQQENSYADDYSLYSVSTFPV